MKHSFNPISKETKKIITEKFSVSIDNINKVEKSYNSLISGISYQYLAHIIRTLETYIRENKEMPFFRITCNPSKPKEPAKGLAWGLYCPQYSYDINYDETADEVQVRVAIAHELGHLFCIIELGEETNSEPLASLFGVIAMIHKFQMKNQKKHHKSEKDIIDDFSLLMNSKKGIKNISS